MREQLKTLKDLPNNYVMEGMCFHDDAQRDMTKYMLRDSLPVDNDDLKKFFMKRGYPREIWDRIMYHMSFGGSVVFDSDQSTELFNDRHEPKPVLFVYHKTNTKEDIISE